MSLNTSGRVKLGPAGCGKVWFARNSKHPLCLRRGNAMQLISPPSCWIRKITELVSNRQTSISPSLGYEINYISSEQMEFFFFFFFARRCQHLCFHALLCIHPNVWVLKDIWRISCAEIGGHKHCKLFTICHILDFVVACFSWLCVFCVSESLGVVFCRSKLSPPHTPLMPWCPLCRLPDYYRLL